MTSGWLFDVYPLDNKMIFWIKQENGDIIRLEDSSWSRSIFVVSDSYTDLLKSIQKDEKNIGSLVKEYEFSSSCYYERIIDTRESKVLKLTLSDSTKALTLSRRIEMLDGSKCGKYRIYNVDLLPAQSYFYEHDIFPLAFCEIHSHGQKPKKLTWINKDDVWSTDYRIPDLKAIHIIVNSKNQGKIPRYTDKIHSITIKQHKETIDIGCNDSSEYDIIKQLKAEVSNIDPDFIFTEDGDSFTFPYLIYRAEKNGAEEELLMSRES